MSDFKYCVHVTAPITSTINADNLRGETRWERNVLDTCVSDNRFVHTTAEIWKSPNPKPLNFYDGYNSAWADESILITHGVPTDPNIPRKAKYYIVNYFDGPDANHADSFLKYNRENPGSIVATCNFKAHTYLSRLRQAFGSENVEWIQGPAVPCVYDKVDNFGKPYLLWLYRNFWYCAERDPNGMKYLFNQIATYMQRRPELRIGIIVGAWDQWAFEDRGTTKSLTPWVWHYDFMKALEPYKDRVDIHVNISWHEVLNLLSNTHLVFSTPEPLGGPPFEGAMFGIPIIVDETSSPFHSFRQPPLFPEVLAVQRNVSRKFLRFIDSLYTDHSFYRQIGDAYRNYVKQNATYSAYLRQIDNMALRRGWK